MGTSGRLWLFGAIQAALFVPLAALDRRMTGAGGTVENTALLGVLAGRDDRLPAAARVFARAKFALLAVVWAYTVMGLGSRLVDR